MQVAQSSTVRLGWAALGFGPVGVLVHELLSWGFRDELGGTTAHDFWCAMHRGQGPGDLFGTGMGLQSCECIFYHTLLSRTMRVSAEMILERRTIPASAKHGHHLTLGRARGLFSTPIFRCSGITGGRQSRIGVPNHRQATRPRCLWRSLDHQSTPPS